MVTCIHAREEMPKQKTPLYGLQTARKKGGVKVLEVEQHFLKLVDRLGGQDKGLNPLKGEFESHSTRHFKVKIIQSG